MKRKTFLWTASEDKAVTQAATKAGMNATEFVRLACNEKMERLSVLGTVAHLEDQLADLKLMIERDKNNLMTQITGAHKDLSRQLNSGLAKELDMHLREQLDVLSRFAATGKVYQPGVNPARVDGVDLPPIIHKPTTK